MDSLNVYLLWRKPPELVIKEMVIYETINYVVETGRKLAEAWKVCAAYLKATAVVLRCAEFKARRRAASERWDVTRRRWHEQLESRSEMMKPQNLFWRKGITPIYGHRRKTADRFQKKEVQTC
jgi:hypothetical protein